MSNTPSASVGMFRIPAIKRLLDSGCNPLVLATMEQAAYSHAYDMQAFGLIGGAAEEIDAAAAQFFPTGDGIYLNYQEASLGMRDLSSHLATQVIRRITAEADSILAESATLAGADASPSWSEKLHDLGLRWARVAASTYAMLECDMQMLQNAAVSSLVERIQSPSSDQGFAMVQEKAGAILDHMASQPRVARDYDLRTGTRG